MPDKGSAGRHLPPMNLTVFLAAVGIGSAFQLTIHSRVKTASYLSRGFGAPSVNSAAKSSKIRYSKATLTNLDKAFARLRDVGTFDCYCGASDASKLFFIGKIATSQPAAAAVAAIRKSVLEPHAKLLQPLLSAKQVDFFVAPGNTEVAVAKGEQALQKVPTSAKKAEWNAVGFRPETYGPDEEGFYVRRKTIPE